jgi:hypothetical protein
MAPSRIDWRTVLMLPPKRRFGAAELARARVAGLDPTTRVAVGLNVAVPMCLFLAFEGPRNPWPYTLVLVLFAAGLLATGAAAWRNPTGAGARIGYWGLPVSTGLAVGLMTSSGTYQRNALGGLGTLVAVGSLCLWFAIVHRCQFIEMRLQEAAEREKSIEMAQRLASAQLEPHFLFNTLASLQHWVQTQDARAAPLLVALTGYLRATLPLFNRPLLPAAEELLAVERYLQVMQMRLSAARLTWRIEVDDALRAIALPPGLLLTLVENAVVHGVEPQLTGGEIVLRSRRDGDAVAFEVQDNGPGPGIATADGVGLANIRERLRLACGDAARLTLDPAPGGGCLARIEWPHPLPTP